MTPQTRSQISAYLKCCRAIALLTLDRLLSQSVEVLLAAAVMMALIGSAAPYLFSWLAIVMPWFCRVAMAIYVGLAAFKAGWQLVNRLRGNQLPPSTGSTSVKRPEGHVDPTR